MSLNHLCSTSDAFANNANIGCQTLAVSGNQTTGGTSNVVGNFSVATNKFNVTAASGNTSCAGTLSSSGVFSANIGTALTAGGAVAMQMGTSPAANPAIYFGSGAPTVSPVVQGSLYVRSDGSSTSTRLYVAGASNAWIAVTTAS